MSGRRACETGKQIFFFGGRVDLVSCSFVLLIAFCIIIICIKTILLSVYCGQNLKTDGELVNVHLRSVHKLFVIKVK